jgi:hypothetical protein
MAGFSGGISLREELSWMLNNTGYWVGWRKFDLTQRSQYWDEVAKEAVAGPPWEYTDYVFKSRRIIPGRSSLENEVLQRYGQVESEALIYFVAWNIDIKEEDLLFRIYDETQSSKPTRPRIRKVYEITRIEPKIDGDLIFNTVKVKIKNNINDTTLRGYVNTTPLTV